MTLDEYQMKAARTLLKKPPREYLAWEIMAIWCAMGLAGEAGETADDIKKSIFHDTGIDRARIIKELGDVFWYATCLCTVLEIPIEIVMIENIKKLEERYPKGFVTGGGKR
jgi:NTP pyrophosphatase (non-canonical NTP hydrolase)